LIIINQVSGNIRSHIIVSVSVLNAAFSFLILANSIIISVKDQQDIFGVILHSGLLSAPAKYEIHLNVSGATNGPMPDLIRHPGVEGNPPQSPFAKGGDERRRLDTARF
jgi:hypothetical protein